MAAGLFGRSGISAGFFECGNHFVNSDDFRIEKDRIDFTAAAPAVLHLDYAGQPFQGQLARAVSADEEYRLGKGLRRFRQYWRYNKAQSGQEHNGCYCLTKNRTGHVFFQSFARIGPFSEHTNPVGVFDPIVPVVSFGYDPERVAMGFRQRNTVDSMGQ